MGRRAKRHGVLMSSWYEETRIARHPLAEIGLAFYVREILRNNCIVNRWDLRATFGPQCMEHITNLKRAGILVLEPVGDMISLKVVAPGDRKRERCRKIGKENRAITRFEKEIVGGRKPAERSSTVKTGRKPK